jgi:N-acetylglucosaminyldiphosphoundecaprenol N-acetyl-beta-D-mannosaminyltransferase
MDKVKILGINIAKTNSQEVISKIKTYLIDGKQHYIVTPNPEIVLAAGRDEEYFYVINNADLAIPDGAGLKIAAWLVGKNISRVIGADLLLDILALAQENQLRVAIGNWRDGLSTNKEISQAIENIFQQISVKVFSIKRIDNQVELPEIKEYQPDIFLVNLGAPWQEKFIFHNLPNLSSVKLAVGLGGAFDFLTGKARRAPFFFRFIGLEWLWRLLKQPQRLKRIINATAVFTYKVFVWKFVLPWFYRKNVACLLYKETATGPHIFIAERSDESGHWQLPQGGIDGEDIKTAGKRELGEEIGNYNFEIIASFNNLWQYEFDKNLSRYQTIRHSGYKGQRQNLVIAKYKGVDDDIKINFWDFTNWQWVPVEKFLKITASRRRKGYEIFISKLNNVLKSSI